MVISGTRRLPVWAWCVGLALLTSAVSGALFVLAMDGHLSEIFHVERLVGHAPGNAETFRWAIILDMLGYYVLLAPLFVAVGRRLFDLGERGAALWTIGALMYVTAGSVAAMALAYGAPPILRGYAQAPLSEREGFVTALTALNEAAVRGVWQTFDPIVTGAWAVASGLALRRPGRRSLGTVGIVLAGAAALFVALRATGSGSELVLYAVSAVFGVAIWGYVLGLTAWLLRDGTGSTIDALPASSA
jgi:hypothetical protein